jgi:hypothetical protein
MTKRLYVSAADTESLHKAPKPQFKIGTFVWFEGQKCKVIASTHTHSQLEGVDVGVSNWRLKKWTQPLSKCTDSPATPEILPL